MAGQQNSNTNKSLMAGIVGMVVGALAGAAAVFLSDEENREKVGKVAGEVKDRGTVVLKDIEKGGVKVKKLLSRNATKSPAKKKAKAKRISS